MPTKNNSSGLGVDKFGGPVVDPTANVLSLVEAAVKRLDDLRIAESRRIDEQFILTRQYAKELADAESKRIDAIRLVDVNAVAVASARAADQATVLANQVVQSAEALRALVASTASTVATQLNQIAGQLSDRIGSLEKAQYSSAGKELVSDPMFKEMLAEMKAARTIQSEGTGLTTGVKMMLGALATLAALLMTALGIVLMVVLRK